MYYVYCSLILTLYHEMQWNSYTVEFIYSTVYYLFPQIFTICGNGCGKRYFIRHYVQDEMKMRSNMFWKQSVSIRNTVI